MAAIEAYFDESYDNDLLCLAGYVFLKSKRKEFDAEWKKLLLSKKLPYFRMSTCAHRTKPFDILDRQDCIAVETQAISLIKEYCSYGIAIAVSPKQFGNLIQPNTLITSAYALCVWYCLVAVRSWADELNKRGSIAYFFESGHRNQSQADVLMSNIFNDQTLKTSYRYSDHGFVDKQSTFPAQAADLLSWQYYTECKRLAKGCTKPRKDYESLIQLRHDVLYPIEENLIQLNDALTKSIYVSK